MTPAKTIGRRPFLVSAAALGASSLLPSLAAAAPKLDEFATYRKLAWAADQRIGFWWLSGTRYGTVGAEMTPFWQTNFGMFFTVRDIAPDEFEVTAVSVGYYTDLATGAYLKKFTNPYTGKTVDIGYFPPKPSKTCYKAGATIAWTPPSSGPGITTSALMGPMITEGPQVWMREEHVIAGKNPASGQAFRVNDLSTYVGLAKEINDPSIAMPLATQAFTDMNTWPGWIGMGDQPGAFYSRLYGAKVASIENMPQVWRDLTKQQFPALYADPKAALAV